MLGVHPRFPGLDEIFDGRRANPNRLADSHNGDVTGSNESVKLAETGAEGISALFAR